MKKVTISLVVFNSEKYLEQMCESLVAQSFSDWNLIVVDNNSYDNSISVIQSVIPQAKIIKKKTNVGFAAGHNLVINLTQSEYVFVITADTLFDKHCLKYLVETMDTRADAASVGPQLLYWDYESGIKTNRIDSMGLELLRNYSVREIDADRRITNSKTREVFGLTGAMELLRRSALLDSSFKTKLHSYREYFDEDFFLYKEDVDLSWRFILFGWKNIVASDAVAYHHRRIAERESKRSDRRKRGAVNRYSYRNHLLMVYKNQFSSITRHHLIKIFAYEFKKFFYLLLLDGSSLKALGDLMRLRKRQHQKRQYIVKRRRISATDFKQWIKQ